MADIVEVLEEERRDLLARLARIDRALAALRDDPVEVKTTPLKRVVRKKPVVRRDPSRKGKVAWLQEAREVLAEAGHPLHWDEILTAFRRRNLPLPDRKNARDTISGVLRRQAREGKDIVHVGPGTFGLASWQNGKRHTLSAAPKSRPESDTTTRLLDIISRNPGLTNGEIVVRLESELNESEEEALAKRNSRITRIGQVFKRGRVQRDSGRYYPINTLF